MGRKAQIGPTAAWRVSAAWLLVAALLSAACGENRATTSESPSGVEPELVVRRGPLVGRVLLTGELKAVEATNIIVPRTPSWQMPIRWMEADGTRVTAGQKVLELDNAAFAGDLEQKRLAEARTINELAQKRADIAVQISDKTINLDRARIGVEKARLEAEVPRELRPLREYQEKQLALERAEVALEKAREELESFRESSEAELEVLRIKLRKSQREIEIAEAAIAALTLHAPVDGILIVAENHRENRKYQVGDNVWVGLPVMRIPDLTAMKVEARLSDVDDGQITNGMRATCTLDTYPDRKFEGEVVDIAPIAKEDGWRSQRRYFRVDVLLDSTDPERMRPGMSVKVAIEPRYRDEALLVPRGALLLDGAAPRARLADGSAVEVSLGPCNRWVCEVLDGLREGTPLGRAG